jgi:hypothetical protein
VADRYPLWNVELANNEQPVDNRLRCHHRTQSDASRRRRSVYHRSGRVEDPRNRIRFMMIRARLAAPVEQVVQEINLFLRGWAGYFRYGNSAHAFDQIRRYALMRLAVFIAKRHQRGRAWGFAQTYCSGDDLGLISLNGIVVAPRPHREKSNTAGERDQPGRCWQKSGSEGSAAPYLEVDGAWRDHLLLGLTVEEVYGSVKSRLVRGGHASWA